MQWGPEREISFVGKDQGKGLSQERYHGPPLGLAGRGPQKHLPGCCLPFSYLLPKPLDVCVCVCVCVCWFNCKIYLAPWPPVSSESKSCPPLQFVILRGVYVAAQHLSFILLSIDIKLPREELSLSLRSCSNGSFFIALGSPFISLQFASGMVLQWGHLHLWSPSLSLFDFSLRFSPRVRNHCIVIYHTFL